MALSRRDFLKLTLKGVIVIGAGSTLQAFAPASFAMPPVNDVLLRFAIASDGHYGQPETDYEFRHDKMIEWLNKEKEGRGVEFTMVNGDLFHNDPSFLPIVKKKWDGLKMPYYVSHGNHDMIDGAAWEKTWGMLLNYTIDKGGTAFIILDTANEKGDYICADVNWAKQQFDKYKSKKHVMVFMHIAPFKAIGGGIDCPEIIALFNQQPNLKAIFHGHDHNLDNVKENEGKCYFWDSHIAGNWGTEYRGYRIVEVLKSGDILTYQMDAATNTKVNSKTV